MTNRDINRSLKLCNDLINIFTDYSFGLDNYFKKKENREDHAELFHEYLILNDSIKVAMKKNGFDMK